MRWETLRCRGKLATMPLNQTKSVTIYQLKITLKDTKPPIWRRVLVPDCTLDDLHYIIQTAMGWGNCHLYAFGIGDTEFMHPDMDSGELDSADATDTTLGDVITKAKQKFIYTYDFGDGWRHEIVVEKIGQPEPDGKYPICIKACGACPPEDVGGPWGYIEFLAAIADPSHEQHNELMAWAGEFDPEAFDIEAVNRELKKTLQ